MIEQIFISINRDGMFSVEYLGVRNIENHVQRHADATQEHLPAFETMLTENGFQLADSNEFLQMRVWSRRGKQLALGVGE